MHKWNQLMYITHSHGNCTRSHRLEPTNNPRFTTLYLDSLNSVAYHSSYTQLLRVSILRDDVGDSLISIYNTSF